MAFNWAPVFQSFGDIGSSIGRARLGAAQYRLQQLLDQLGISEKQTGIKERQLGIEESGERLRRLKLTPDTEEERLNQQFAAYEKIIGRKLTDQEKQLLLGIPWQAQTNPLQKKIADAEAVLGRKLSDDEKGILAGIESKPKDEPEKRIEVRTTKSGEPFEVVDENGKSYRVGDPNMPQRLKDFLADWQKAEKTGEDKAATVEARKSAEAIDRAIKIGDARALEAAYKDLKKRADRGVAGHSFLKTVAQEVNMAEITGGRGTTSGDMLIIEGFMQLMFGVDPKALRGSPKMMEVLLKQGGWDDRAIAAMNSALTGGRLSQDVRKQILDAANRQVGSWDQAVIMTGSLADDPKTKALVQKYTEAIANGEGDAAKALGATPQ